MTHSPLHTLSLSLLALALSSTAQQAIAISYGQGLGRLLTTEPERAKLDDLRFNVAPPKVYEGPTQLEIQGISQRPGMPKGQDITVWIDRRAYQERDLPVGLKLVRDKNGEIIGMTSRQAGGKLEFAKIGEMISRPQTKEEANAQAQAELDANSNKPAANSQPANANPALKKLEDISGTVTDTMKALADKAKSVIQKQ